METLKLDCDSVLSIASSIESSATQMTELGEKIKSYEIPEDDDFNFTTPRSAIAANILNSAEKITNTSKIINSVVEDHTELQNSQTFDTYVEEKERKAAEEAAAAAAAASGRSYVGASEAYSTAGAYYSAAGSTTLAEAVGLTEDTPTTEDKPEEKTDEKEIKNTIEFGEAIAAPTLGYVISTGITEENEPDDRLDAEYDEKTGLLKVEDKFVIRCDETLGKVGDAIVITTASGATISCVIGSTYKAEEGQETTVEFYSNSTEEITEVEGIPSKDDKITKADNYGSIDEEKFKEEEAKEETPDDTVKEDEGKSEEENKTGSEENKEENNESGDETKEETTEEVTDDGFPTVSIGNSGGTEVVIEDPVPTAQLDPTITENNNTNTNVSYTWTSANPEVKDTEENENYTATQNNVNQTKIDQTDTETGGNN